MAQTGLAQRMGALIGRLRIASSLLWRWEARFKGVTIVGPLHLAGRPILSVASGSRLHLGPGVQLNSSVRANPLGCFQPCVLRTLSPDAVLELGPNVGLSATALIAGKSIVVGEGTIFGAGALVVDNDFHAPEGEWGWSFDCTTGAKPVRIGRGCFIGARAIVLKGVTIGDRAVVGAGAVVTRDVPAGHRAVGNPARVLPISASARDPKV